MAKKIKKIGIITFHNAINYGAILQIYALSTFLLNNGYDCEVIDYQNEKFKHNYKAFRVFSKDLKGLISACIKIPNNFVKNKRFKRFLVKNVHLSDKKYNISNIKLSNNEYNIFITGSDQVWNYILTNDYTYFLNFVKKPNKKISYAASTGSGSFEYGDINEIKKDLEDFDEITVRESELKSYMENNFNIKSEKVLDPVFLLSVDEWNKFIKNDSSPKYVFVYMLNENGVYDIAKKISNKLNIKVICVQNTFSKKIKAKYKLNASVEEFLNLIKNAEYVVTDSFHGAAFSIIFRKNLKIVYKKNFANLNIRLKSLVEEFNLQSLVVDNNTPILDLIKPVIYNNELIEKSVKQSREKVLKMVGE